MAINSLNALNSLRLSGLASGMDTESMVKSLMSVERMKYDKLAQQKTLMDWRKDANLEVNNLLRAFRDDYLSMLKPENYMLNASAVQAYKVNMAASNSIRITASGDVMTGAHKINSITSLAAGANAASAAPVSAGALSVDTQLGSLALNSALTFEDGMIAFTINGKAFSFSASDTLRTVINRVNNDADANAQMSYSSLSGKFTITSKAMGSGSNLVITNIKGNAFAAAGAAFGIAGGAFANGSDAVLSIDGIGVVKNTNNFTIDGISYALTGETASAIDFTVEQDIDGAVTRIKSFVDAYNKLATALEDKLIEERHPDYAPLSDEQKDEMSETQVEKWEKLAKSGMLRGDSHITRLLADIRRGFYDTVAGTDGSAASIGLGTYSYYTKGLIQLDETKLRAALKSDPNKVANILTGSSASVNAAAKYSESGVAARMQTAINGYINDYLGYRTDSTNSQYSRLEDSMERMERTLQAKEERYWRRFSQMEEAISRMNSQSSWLAQQFSAGS